MTYLVFIMSMILIGEIMPEYSPTPDEIEERCLEVQSTWDEATRESRKTGLPQKDRSKGWTPPVIDGSYLKCIIKEHIQEIGETVYYDD